MNWLSKHFGIIRRWRYRMSIGRVHRNRYYPFTTLGAHASLRNGEFRVNVFIGRSCWGWSVYF